MIDMETVTARRNLLVASARCHGCRSTRGDCDAQAVEVMAAEGVGLACCPECSHPVSVAAMDALLTELASGTVRTVEEVDPPPVLGPQRAGLHWLLWQRVWWQPQYGPMLKIHAMTDTHRLHTARMLDRKAAPIAFSEHTRMAWLEGGPLGPQGDMSRDAFDRELTDMIERPHEWLADTPLLVSLTASLPDKDGKKRQRKAWSALLERAEHWSACPANRNLDDPCLCRVEHPDDPEVGPPVDRGLFDEASGKGVL